MNLQNPLLPTVQQVVRMMVDGKLPQIVSHADLVQEIVSRSPDPINGRNAWNLLSTVISSLRQCSAWKNCFSLVGVHGKGSRRQLEYHPEACDVCEKRLDCLTRMPIWAEG
jgi:hypothetical protein